MGLSVSKKHLLGCLLATDLVAFGGYCSQLSGKYNLGQGYYKIYKFTQLVGAAMFPILQRPSSALVEVTIPLLLVLGPSNLKARLSSELTGFQTRFVKLLKLLIQN